MRAKTDGIAPHGCDDANSLKFWVHYKKEAKPKIFNFAFFSTFFGNRAYNAASKLTELWAMGAKQTARNRHRDLENFFEHISGTDVPQSAPLSTALIDNSVPFRTWQSAVDDWGGGIKAKYGAKPRTAGQIIANVNRSLTLLQRLQVFPKICLPSIPKNAHKKSSQRATLAQQITVDGSISKRIGDLVDELSSRFSDPEDKEYAKAELLALAKTLGDALPTSPEGLVAALQQVQRTCINTIETIASSAFRQWQTHQERCAEYLRSADEILKEMLCKAIGGDQHACQWLSGFGATFTREALIGSSLQCFLEHFDGIPPCLGNAQHKTALKWLYKNAVSRFEFDALLNPTPDAVAAAMLLCACETGVNVSVLCELSSDLGIKPIPGDATAFSFEALKRRAGNKFVVSILRTERDDGVLPTITALLALQTGLAAFRKALATTNLFVFRFGDKPSHASGEFLANRLKYLLRNSGLDSKYKFTPSAIRVCFLMLHGIDKSPDSLIERQLAGHGEDSTATSRYEFRLEQRLRLSAYARQYQERATRFAEAVANGQIDTVAEANTEDDFRHSQIVDLSDDVILDAVLTTRCLERANDDLVQNRRSHWLYVCEPELAWATVLLEKAEKSALAHRVAWAHKEADRLVMAGFVHHLE